MYGIFNDNCVHLCSYAQDTLSRAVKKFNTSTELFVSLETNFNAMTLFRMHGRVRVQLASWTESRSYRNFDQRSRGIVCDILWAGGDIGIFR